MLLKSRHLNRPGNDLLGKRLLEIFWDLRLDKFKKSAVELEFDSHTKVQSIHSTWQYVGTVCAVYT